jgi:hypothetical protein
MCRYFHSYHTVLLLDTNYNTIYNRTFSLGARSVNSCQVASLPKFLVNCKDYIGYIYIYIYIYPVRSTDFRDTQMNYSAVTCTLALRKHSQQVYIVLCDSAMFLYP